ncbi:hypothetical protein PYW08_004507 [Mythimna loreyi]|uniref:Uncharacterized protein n=1 Tax=Mythimna loreyi TaxID=667449 RepID=A0ACC2QQ33_9NEOP|nr:hypothetical protein PYW08_004507 [Mythimna loreyi]
MSQKRIRSTNWDEEEKQLFRMVFKEHAQIIENKSLDTNSNRTKVKAWEQVHTKFNQLNSRPRELSQLKIQWKTMKVNARKSYSAFKREANKPGGGTRPPTPNDAVMEIKDLLNPAELLRDDNLYDSDGVVVGKVEIKTTGDLCNAQNSNLTQPVENSNMEEDQITNTACIETVEDVDDQVSRQKFTPVISPLVATPATQMATKMDSIVAKNTQDTSKSIMTPVINRDSTPAKVAKRKINLNNIMNCDKNSKKEDYVNSMVSHSKMLKDEEHMRRMEMAEEEHAMNMEIRREEHAMNMEIRREEHAINMEIRRENLKYAILQRSILELKEHELLSNKQSLI